MRKATFGLAALVAPAIIGAVLASGCDKVKDSATGASEDLCGPCGAVATGDIGISGNAKLDGFFKAVADLNSATLRLQAGFISDLAALEAAFGLKAEADASLSARVDALIAQVQAEMSANVDGGLAIEYAPPKCSANVSVAVDAQASCEAKADVNCEAKVDPGKIEVECSGQCSGGCDAECKGDFSCKVQAPSVKCEGKCEGSCELDVAAKCEGTCHGECDGTCSAEVQNAQGEAECSGTCDGECKGSCELKAAAECSGKCTGSCLVNQGSAQCTADAQCEGECSGKCSGSCVGEATPPSAGGKCDAQASADCQAQASAQADANLECTPPSLDIVFAFSAEAQADVDMQAKFRGEIEALKVHGVAMLQSFAQYKALIDGEVNGEVVFDPSPAARLQASLKGIAKAGVNGDLTAGIPTFRIGCAIGAMSDSVKMVGTIIGDAAANIKAQGKFAAALTGGFKS